LSRLDIMADDLATAQSAVLVPSDDIPEGKPEIMGIDFNNEVTLDSLLSSYITTGFQATHLGQAIRELNLALDDREKEVEEEEKTFPYPEGRKKRGLTLFMGYTSNLVSSGLRESIRYCVEHDLVDCVVTTAGGIEEDIIKCLRPSYVGAFTDKGAELRKHGINRVGNILVPNRNYCDFENWLIPILDKCLEEQKEGFLWTPSKLIRRLGLEIKDRSSILYWAAVHSIPIFSPALTDGSLGDMLYFHSVKNDGGLRIDIVEDVRHINTMAVKSEKSGVLIMGGGVVKHHINNANLMRNGSDYTIFINTGQEFDGSDSGASPDEAVSWGKIKPNASSVKVCADATLVFPLLVSQTFAKRVKKE
ncbi:hypothetical protein PENTCL1PPCAC_6909, partial [Pristionchus entomophagus]